MRAAFALFVSFACLALRAAGPAEGASSANSRLPGWFSAASALINTDAAEAQRRAETRLAAARDAKDRREEILALAVLAGARQRLNDLPAALAHTRVALQLAERTGDTLVLIQARDARARALLGSGDIAAAIEYFLQNLAAARRERLPRAELDTLLNLGVAYERVGDAARAREIKQQALAEAEAMGDREATAVAALHLGHSDRAEGDPQAARGHFAQALAIRRELGNRTAIADVEEELARLDLEEGQPEVARQALQRIVAQRRTLRGRLKLTDSLRYLVSACLAVGRLDEALAYAKEARGYAEAIESRRLRADVYAGLALVHEARGEFQAALDATRRATVERDAMAGEVAQQRVAELQTRFDIARKDEDLARLARDNEMQAAHLAQNAAEIRASEAELARARLQRFVLGGVVAMLTLLLGTVAFAQRARLRAARRLHAATEAARRAAEGAAALKTQLLGVVSHDLRTPLQTLSLRSRALLAAADDPATVRDAATQIDAESARLLRLVHDLLDVSAIEHGGVALRRTPQDLGTFVASVVEAHRPRARQRGVNLAFLPPAASLSLPFDAARLGQALSNLLDNALKFTPAGRSVEANVLARNATACIAIRDEGPGIGPAELGRMFRPFSAPTAEADSMEPSTGLGLYIAREMVARHGGRLDVRSQPGEGTTFEIVLPIAAPANPPGAESQGRQNDPAES